jgi:hypothetical protein
MHFALKVPTVPVQRRMRLGEVVAARARIVGRRPGWPAIFIKAYSLVSAEMPALRRAYVALPWPHLCESPTGLVSVAFEREYRGEPGVFFGRIRNADEKSLAEVHNRIRGYTERPLDKIGGFKKIIRFTRLPRPFRRLAIWVGLNTARFRFKTFGTFGLSVYSALGAESLHPLAPVTTTLNYGVIGRSGRVDVRIIYDHRVLDGATVARALARLEEVLHGPILDELGGMAGG